MLTRTRIVALLLLAGMLAAGAAVPGTALAEDDLFLNLGDIVGGSTDAHHSGEIVLLSYSQSFTQLASAGGNCGPITVMKLIDKSSPALIGAVLLGQHTPKAVITFRKPGTAFEYYKVTLRDVLIQSITQSDRSPDTIVEQVTLVSTVIMFTYFVPSAATGAIDSTVTFRWNCKNNTPG